MPKKKALVKLAAALAGLAVAVGLAACGPFGGGNKPESASEILDKTFSGDKEIKSANLNVNITFAGQNIPNLTKPLTARISGPFQKKGKDQLPEFDFNLEISAEGQTFTAGAVVAGDKGFVKYQGTNYEVPAEIFTAFKQGFENASKSQGTETNGDTGKASTNLAALGIDPRKWLKDPKISGSAQAGGVDTNKLSAGVDMDKLVEDLDTLLKRAGSLNLGTGQNLPDKLSDKDKQKIKTAVQNPTFELYSGKEDSILRKLVIRVKFVKPDDAKQTADVSVDIELNGVNEPQTIQAPTDTKPLDELLNQLGIGGLGGLGGLGGGTGGGSDNGKSSGGSTGGSTGGGKSSGSTGGTSPDEAQKYLDCVGKAKSQAEMQKCVELLTKK